MENKLLSVQEAANLLKVSIKTLHRWEEKGALIPERTAGNHRRYKLEDINAFQKSKSPLKISEENYIINSTPSSSDADELDETEETPPIRIDKLVSSSSTSNKVTAETRKTEVKPANPTITNPESEVTKKTEIEYAKYKPNKKALTFLSLMMLLITTGIVIQAGLSRDADKASTTARSQGNEPEAITSILDINRAKLDGEVQLFIPAIFNRNVTVKADTLIDGSATVSGTLTAPNIVYSVIGGQNISITGDPQNPIISTGPLVSSFGGQTGDLELAAGTGISINELEISLTNTSITVTAGNGLAGGGNVALGGSVSLTNAGVTSITGTDNQIIASSPTGAVNLSLPQDIALSSSPTFSSLNLTAATDQLILGSGNTGTLTLGTLTADRTYTLPDLTVTNDTICLAILANCTGGSGGIGGSGTTNRLARFTSANTLGNASINDLGSAVAMTIDASGNVGIGTTTPAFNLTVISSSPTQASFNSTGSNSAGISINNSLAGQQSLITFLDAGISKFQIGKQTNNSFFLYDSANSRDSLRVTSGDLLLVPVGGNVGIGTTTPTSFKLEAAGNVGPEADNTRDLGSAIRRWANIYGTNVIATNLSGAITPTGFTQGSVVFAGTGGTLTQDNANFFWDDTNNRLHVGTSGGTYGTRSLSIYQGGLFLRDESGVTTSGITQEAYGLPPSFRMRRAQGTLSSPSAVGSGQSIGQLLGGGYGTTGFFNDKAQLLFSAAENWSDTAQGTNITFWTTGSGSTITSERMRIDSSGNVGIGTTTPTSFKLEAAGNVGPEADNTRDLGSAIRRWANIYGTNVIATNLSGAITPTGFTQGSVVFAGTGGTLTQDNANFFWDDTNNFLGVGTSTPQAKIHILADSGLAANLQFDRYVTPNSSAAILFRRARGTASSPTAVAAGDNLGQINFRGYGTTGFSTGAPAQIRGDAEETFTDTAWGTRLIFSTTTNGTTTSTERMRIDNAGNVGIGTTTPVSALHVSNANFPVATFERTSSQTNATRGTARFLHTTSADMIDDFGVAADWGIQDSAGVANTIASIRALRAGADNTGRLEFQTATAGTLATAMSILSNGNVGIGDTSPSSRLEVGDGTDSLQISSVGDLLFVDADGGSSITGPQGGALAISSANSHDLTLTASDDIIFDDAQLLAGLNLSLADTAIDSNLTQGIVDAINDLYDLTTGGGTGAIWSRTSGVIHPTTATDDFTIGGSTLAASIFGIDESAGNFYFGYDNTASPTLNFEATDADAGEFGFNTNDAFFFSNASLGIGITNPQAKLTVTGANQTGGLFAVEFSDGSDWFTVGEEAGLVKFNAQGGRTEIGGSGNLGARLNVGSLTAAGIPLAISGISGQTGDLMRIDTFGTGGNQFIIKAAGNVGIGLTNPGATLEIAPANAASQKGLVVRASANASPGNVFEVVNSGASLNHFAVGPTGLIGINTTVPTGTIVNISGTHPGTASSLTGLSSNVTFPATTTVLAQGFQSKITTAASAFTLAEGRTILAAAPTVGAGSAITTQYGVIISNMGATGITDAYGLHIGAQNGASGLNIGASIAAASTQTLWLSSNTDTTTAAAGIAFGASRDTNLYRAAADSLKTDDSFVIAGSPTAASSKALEITNTGAVTGTGYGGYFAKIGASTTNVGLYSTATGATNNYAAIFEAGNVGIGTTNPNYPLTVSSSSAPYIKLNAASGSTEAQLLLTDQDTIRWQVGKRTNNDFMIFRPSSAGDFTIQNSTGNVGIGTTAPGAKLDVSPTITATADLKGMLSGLIYNGASAMTNYYGHYIAAPTGTGTITNKYALVTEANAGNVGIGTTAPAALFSVGSTSQFQVSSLGRVGLTEQLDIVGTYALLQSANAGIDLMIRTAAGTGDIIFQPNNSEAIRITDAGNVGIGDTDPLYQLTVGNGDLFGVNSSGNIVWEGATADAFELTLAPGNVGQDSTVTIPDPLAATDTVCLLTLGNCSGGSSGVGGTGTANRVAYWNGTSTLAADDDFFFDGTNVGIGTTSPQTLLHVKGDENLRLERNNAGAYVELYNNQANPAADTFAGLLNFMGNDSGAAIQSYAQIVGGVTSDTAGAEGGHLRFYTTGSGTVSERLRIDLSGNVGIGTTAPQRKLQITSGSGESATQLALHRTDGIPTSSALSFRLDTTGVGAASFVEMADVIARHTVVDHATRNTQLEFWTTGAGTLAQRMTILGGGNVGIGTTEPGTKLDINAGSAIGFRITTADDVPYAMLINNTAAAQSWGTYVGNDDALRFYDVTDSRQVMTLDGSGNVGIGTTTPGAPLDVKATSSSSDRGARIRYFSSDANGAALRLWTARGTETTPLTQVNGDVLGTIDFQGHDGTSRVQGAYITAAINGAVSTGVLPTDLIFFTGSNGIPSERLRISSAGNVGIGTTAPSEKLQVSGDVAPFRLYSRTGVANALAFNVSYNGSSWQNDNPAFASGMLHFGGGGLEVYSDPAGSGLGTTRLSVRTSGNVGVGTGGPTGLFQVSQPTAGTGTVATNGTTTLTGTNTQFLNTFKVGDTITVSGETIRTIATIPSNTSLTVSVAFSTTASGLSYTLTGGDRFTVLGNGNVGIGTSSLGNTELTVQSNNQNVDVTLRAIGTGQYSVLNFGDEDNNSAGQVRYDHTTDRLEFTTNGVVQRAVIDSSGNLGIGTTAPTAQLQVQGSSTSSGATTMTAGNGATTFTTSASITLNAGDYIVPATTNVPRAVSIGGTGTSFTVSSAFTSAVSGETFTIHRPITNLANSSGASALFVQGDTGNVGIGTSNILSSVPSSTYKLQVHATSGSVASALTTDAAANAILVLGTDFDAAIGVRRVGQIGYDYTNNVLKLVNGESFGSSSNGIAIDTSGNVGIGDTTPSSRLEVGDGTDSLQISSVGDLLFVDADGGASITGPAGGALAISSASSQDLTLTASDDIIFDDLQLTTGLNLTVADTAINASLTQGIVDAINDLYDLGTGGGGASIWSRTSAVIHPTTATDDLAIGGSTVLASMFGIDESAGNFYFGYDNSASPTLNFEATDGDSGEFGFNTNDAFYFNNSNVGIGTTNPGSLLEVAGKGQFGTAAASTSQLTVLGGASGGAMITLSRTTGATIQYSWALAGGGLSFSDDTNGMIPTNIFGDSSTAQLFLGQRGKITTDAFSGLLSGQTFSASAGTDVNAHNLTIRAGAGTGAGANGHLIFSTKNTLASGTTAQTYSERLRIEGNTGNVGIGTTSPTSGKLQVAVPSSGTGIAITGTFTDGTTRNSGLFSSANPITFTPTTQPVTVQAGIDEVMVFSGTVGAAGGVYGINSDLRLQGSGSFGDLGNYNPAVIATKGFMRTISPFSGTITGEMVAGWFGVAHTAGAGTVNKMIGLEVAAPGYTAGGTVNGPVYGARIANQGNAAWTTSYGLYVDPQSGSTNSYSAIFEGGNVGIGTTAPGALLDVDMPDASSITTEKINIRGAATTQTLTDGTTIADWRHNQFIAPTLNGVAAGGTETVTNAATLYVNAAPSGSNITITNPYALWVDAGLTRIDGSISLNTTSPGTAGTYLLSSANSSSLSSSSQVYGLHSEISNIGTGSIQAVRGYAQANVAGTVAQVAGITGGIRSMGASTVITSGRSLEAITPSVTGTITTQNGLYVANQGATGVTTAYGIYVAPQSGATNNYAAVFEGGNVGIGITNPGNTLSVTGTANVTGHTAFGNTATVDQNFINHLGTSTAASTVLNIRETFTQTSPSVTVGLNSDITWNPSGALSGDSLVGISAAARTASGNSQNFSGMSPLNAYGVHNGTGTLSNIFGLNVARANLSTGTITTSYGSFIANTINSGGGTLNNNYGIFIGAHTTGSTANAGILIGEASGGNNSNLVLGQVTVPSGSYSIYNSSADQNYFAGNVGIGITNPSSILHTIASGAKTTTFTGNLLTNTATSSTASINKYGLEIQSTGTWNGTSANNVGLYVSSVTGGTNNYDAIFNGGGNVGIGTTGPGTLLELESTNPIATLDWTNTANYGAVNFQESGVYRGAMQYIGSTFATTTRRNNLEIVNAIGGGAVSLWTNAIERVRVDGTSGNVGIGTTAPGALLDVDRADIASNSELIDIRSQGFTQTITAGLSNARFNQFNSSTITAASAQTVTNAATVYIAGAPIAAGSATITNNYAMWVDSGNARFDGNVGIGTTAPTRTLDVAGSWGGNVVTSTIVDSGTGTTTLSTAGLAYLLILSNTDATNDVRTFNITGVPNTEGTFIFVKTQATDSLDTGTATINVQINGTQVSTITASTNGQTVFENYTIAYMGSGWRIVGLNSGTAQPADGSDTADLAEWIPYTGEKPEPGDILTAGDKAISVKKSEKEYDSKLIGIVTTNPHTVMSVDDGKSVRLALSGRVPVKVASDSPAISTGDYITSSDEAGKAMKATRAGQMIGKALEDWTPGSGKETVMVFVTTSYGDPNSVLANLAFDAQGNLVLPTFDEEEAITELGGTPTANSQQPTAKRDLGWTLSDIVKRITKLEEKVASGSATVAGTGVSETEFAELTGKVDNIKLDQNSLVDRVSSLESDISRLASSSALLNPNPYALTPEASNSAELSLDTLDTKDAIISNTLSVGGRTTLSDVGITGRMNIGLLSIEGLSDPSTGSGLSGEAGYATINTTSGDLHLQSDGVNGIDILNGKITITPSGNMKVNGTVTVKKLNVDIAEVAGASLGEAILEAGKTSIVIDTSSVTAKSKIFVTPKSKTSLPLSVTQQTAGVSFKVEINAPSTSDIKFSWFIIN